MSQLLDKILALPLIVQIVAALLPLLFLSFVIFFAVPSVGLLGKLASLRKLLRSLKQAGGMDPYAVPIADERLDHLWREYCGTLHTPRGDVDPGTGIADPQTSRATIQAEVIFNSQTVFESRIHTEFFKHLPGLLTGLGIIATFFGLIDGLARASTSAGLDTALLIGAVEETFLVSASAISLAMLVTFFEKFAVSHLHRQVEQLGQDVDRLFSSGVGEEYLARLVQASEASAAQAKILKDALMEDLTAVLERLTESQIAAGARQQEQLQHNLAATLQSGLVGPLETISNGFGKFQGEQGDKLGNGLKDAMAVFVEQLKEMLGGQIGQARDLQAETLQSLEKAVASFEAMAQNVGKAGADATSSMADGIKGVLEDMAARQAEMNGAMRQLADELRGSVAQSQDATQAHLGRVVEELGKQVAGVVGQLQSEAEASSAAHGERLTEVTTHAKASVDVLAEGVRAQTAAIEQATAGMRAAVSDLAGSAGRNIALMNEGAGRMREAADRFTASGAAMGEVLTHARDASGQLVQSAGLLSAASRDVAAAVDHYKAASNELSGLVEGLRDSISVAKREIAMTHDLVSRLESAALKLAAAEGQADAYLEKVTEVLAKNHGTFTSQMAESVRSANGDFHNHLADSVNLLATTINDLDGVIIEFKPKRPPHRS